MDAKRFVTNKQKIDNIIKEYENKFDSTDKNILKLYTQTDMMYYIHDMLRYNKIRDVPKSALMKKMKVKSIDEFSNVTKKVIDDIRNIMKTKGIQQDITTYRGGDNALMDIFENMKPGQEIPTDSFSSTSLSKKSAEKFAGIHDKYSGGDLMEIRIPSGSRAIYLGKVSKFKGEKEVLIDTNVKFKLVKFEKEYIKDEYNNQKIRRRAIVEIIS